MTKRPLRTYDESVLSVLLNFDWSSLGTWHEKRDTGVWVLPLSSGEAASLTESQQAQRLAHPTANLGVPALPFPFTLMDFIAFCNAAPVFDWERVESVYTNDDGKEDLAATAELRRVSEPAYELVQGYLWGNAAPGELGEEAEAPRARRLRRLEKFREMGGEFRRAGDGSWQSSGKWVMSKLAREEQAARRPRSTREDVDDDVKAAWAAELGS